MNPARLAHARRALLLVLVALAIAIRAAVPAGWMPMAQAGGATRLVLCPGGGSMAPGMTMPSATPDRGERRHDPVAPAGHECPFAVTALAVDLTSGVAIARSPVLLAVATTTIAPTPLPGRGLAAPPPPATGPPPPA